MQPCLWTDHQLVVPVVVGQSEPNPDRPAGIFGRQHLQDLVDIGGKALRQEDQFIRNAVLNRSRLQGWFGKRLGRFGIRRVENERFYQYLVWRALLKEFEFPVDLEREGNYDFVVWDGAESESGVVAVGEMKRWVSSSGKVELPGIVRDIQKIKYRGCPGFILITTAFEAGKLKDQVDFLSRELRVPAHWICRSTFSCLHGSAIDCIEFALLGFMAADSSIPTQNEGPIETTSAS